MSEPMTKSEVLEFCSTNNYSPVETERLIELCGEIWKKHRQEKNNLALSFASCTEQEKRSAEKLELDKKWWALFLFFLIFILKKNQEEAREALRKKLAEERDARTALAKMRAAIRARQGGGVVLEEEQEPQEDPPAFKI